jgi:hypothetical protein
LVHLKLFRIDCGETIVDDKKIIIDQKQPWLEKDDNTILFRNDWDLRRATPSEIKNPEPIAKSSIGGLIQDKVKLSFGAQSQSGRSEYISTTQYDTSCPWISLLFQNTVDQLQR